MKNFLYKFLHYYIEAIVLVGIGVLLNIGLFVFMLCVDPEFDGWSIACYVSFLACAGGLIIILLEMSFTVKIDKEKIIIRGYRGIMAQCKIENVKKAVFLYGSKGFAGIKLEEKEPREGIYKRSMLTDNDGLRLYPRSKNENDKIIKILKELLPEDVEWTKADIHPFKRKR